MNPKTQKILKKLVPLFFFALILITCFFVFFPQNLTYEVSEEQARAFLIENYNPGSCYGMPQIIRDGAPLPEPKIEITREANNFNYEIWDGHCCSITTYKGVLTYSNGNFSDNLISNKTESVPC